MQPLPNFEPAEEWRILARQARAAPTPREYSEVQKDLDNILSKIQATNDSVLHRSLLHEMTLLLQEAEYVSQLKDPLPQIQSAARPKK